MLKKLFNKNDNDKFGYLYAVLGNPNYIYGIIYANSEAEGIVIVENYFYELFPGRNIITTNIKLAKLPPNSHIDRGGYLRQRA